MCQDVLVRICSAFASKFVCAPALLLGNQAQEKNFLQQVWVLHMASPMMALLFPLAKKLYQQVSSDIELVELGFGL
jgi:hypothetical protein